MTKPHKTLKIADYRMTAWRLPPEIDAAMALIKERTGIPLNVQLRKAMLLYCEQMGVDVDVPNSKKVARG